MGNRLVISVEKSGEPMLAIYWHWDADCSSTFVHKCELLKVLDKDDSLEEMLRKICEIYPKAGLITSESWWAKSWRDSETVKEYADEIDDVKKMLDKGILKERTGTMG